MKKLFVLISLLSFCFIGKANENADVKPTTIQDTIIFLSKGQSNVISTDATWSDWIFGSSNSKKKECRLGKCSKAQRAKVNFEVAPYFLLDWIMLDNEMGTHQLKNHSFRYTLGMMNFSYQPTKWYELNFDHSIEFNSIHFDTPYHIEKDPITRNSILTNTYNGNIETSRLHITYWNMRLYNQFKLANGRLRFIPYVGAKILLTSSSKIWKDGSSNPTKLDNTQNLRPILPEVGAMISLKGILGFNVSYVPLTIYQNGKGPKTNMMTMGLTFFL